MKLIFLLKTSFKFLLIVLVKDSFSLTFEDFPSLVDKTSNSMWV